MSTESTATCSCLGKGASTHDINGNVVEYCNCDLTPILQRSIELIEARKRVKDLEHDVTLLTAQLHVARLRVAKLTPKSIYTGEKQHECASR